MPNTNHIPPAHIGARVELVGGYVGLVRVPVGSLMIFGYHHVGIGHAKWSRRGSEPTQGPNANVTHRLHLTSVYPPECVLSLVGVLRTNLGEIWARITHIRANDCYIW